MSHPSSPMRLILMVNMTRLGSAWEISKVGLGVYLNTFLKTLTKRGRWAWHHPRVWGRWSQKGKQDPVTPASSPSTSRLPHGEEPPVTIRNGAKDYGLKPQELWVKVTPALRVVGQEFPSEWCKVTTMGHFYPRGFKGQRYQEKAWGQRKGRWEVRKR